MIYKIVMLPGGIADVKVAAKWYNSRQNGLGKKFISHLREYQKILQTNPHFIARYKKVHTLPLKKFPFMIHFVIDEKKKYIFILAVLHTSMNTDKWPG